MKHVDDMYEDQITNLKETADFYFSISQFEAAKSNYLRLIQIGDREMQLKCKQNLSMILQKTEYAGEDQVRALDHLSEVIDSEYVTWKTYYLRAISRLETFDLMGANLDIYEAQHRLKNSSEKSGSYKKKVLKLKRKIEDAFEIKKPNDPEEEIKITEDPSNP